MNYNQKSVIQAELQKCNGGVFLPQMVEFGINFNHKIG